MIHHVQQNLSSLSSLHLLRRLNEAGGNMEAWDSMMASTCNPSIQEIETGDQKLKFGAGELAGSGVKSTRCYSKKPQFPTENNHL